jgi:hypothetical protein
MIPLPARNTSPQFWKSICNIYSPKFLWNLFPLHLPRSVALTTGLKKYISSDIILIWLGLFSIIIVNISIKLAEISTSVLSSYHYHTWLHYTYLIVIHSYISVPEGLFSIHHIYFKNA